MRAQTWNARDGLGSVKVAILDEPYDPADEEEFVGLWSTTTDERVALGAGILADACAAMGGQGRALVLALLGRLGAYDRDLLARAFLEASHHAPVLPADDPGSPF